MYWYAVLNLGILYSIVFEFYYFYEGIAVIIGHVFFFLMGGFIVESTTASNDKGYIKNKRYEPSIFHLKLIIFLFTLMGVLSLDIFLKSQGFTFASVFRSGGLFSIANTISVARYGRTLSLPLSYQVLSAFVYSGIFFSGILFVYKKKKIDNLFVYMPLFISFANAMLNGARAGLLMGILLFASAILTTYIINGTKVKLINLVKSSAILVSILLFILIFVQVLRGGKEVADYMPIVEHMMGYIFGSLNAFSIWWVNHNDISLGFGQYAFSGIHNVFFGGRESGLFSVPVDISKNNFSNVYTVFRSTIEDFSLGGSFLIFFILGFISTAMYHKIYKNRYYFVMFSMIYFIIFWSFITNPIMYNTLLLSWLINLAYIKYIFRSKKYQIKREVIS
jgi:oligosaccharide repeat unit polymerase